jgi:hypothetical protein
VPLLQISFAFFQKEVYMASKDTVLGNFHQPSSYSHPDESIGNQQIFDNGTQVGSLEYVVDDTGSVDIQVYNTDGDHVADLD